jgi:hypothetical protein
MNDQSGGGPNSGPPASTPEDRLKAFQKKVADSTAENQTPRRTTIDPLAYGNPGLAQTQIDAVKHDKIIQQRTQQQGQQQGQPQKPTSQKPRDDPTHAQSGTKEISDAPHRQRNQGNQPGRYRDLMNASQTQQASNANKGPSQSSS